VGSDDRQAHPGALKPSELGELCHRWWIVTFDELLELIARHIVDAQRGDGLIAR
jgi:hypothetical protein